MRLWTIQPSSFYQNLQGKGIVYCDREGYFNAIEVVYPKRQIISGLVREERNTYPHLAVREGILNAIVHRDYTDNN